MQALVSMIAMMATVVHFTIGCCCTHPDNAHAGSPSCHKTGKAVANCCCHHGHAIKLACDSDACDHGQSCQSQSHQCSDCDCIATVSTKGVPNLNNMQVVAFVANFHDLIQPWKTAVADRLEPDPFAYAGLRRHSIFERFQI